MMVFSGLAINMDLANDGQLYHILTSEGEENVLFTLLIDFPFGKILGLLVLLMIFISYVTAADSNKKRPLATKRPSTFSFIQYFVR